MFNASFGNSATFIYLPCLFVIKNNFIIVIPIEISETE